MHMLSCVRENVSSDDLANQGVQDFDPGKRVEFDLGDDGLFDVLPLMNEIASSSGLADVSTRIHKRRRQQIEPDKQRAS